MPQLLSRPAELVIFDWDGTLMDSEQAIVETMHSAITDMELEPRSDAEVSNIIGLGLLEAVTALYPGSDEPFAQELADHYRNHFRHVSQGREDLFPGVMELLEQLIDEGIKVAVATGKSRRGLNLVLKATQLEDLFHSSRCADETRSKPHPQMLFESLQELNIAPEAAIMVGDTEYDLEMATRAGMASVGVCYGVHAAERLHQHGPLACIEHISAIREIVPLAAPTFEPNG